MRTQFVRAIIVTFVLLIVPSHGYSQNVEGGNGVAEAHQLVLAWNAQRSTCQDQTTSAAAAIAACEQRDVLSKRLTQLNYCYAQANETSAANWRSCRGDATAIIPGTKGQLDLPGSRTTAKLQRLGGVFVLPALLNGSIDINCIVDSGATHVQIPEDIVEEMRRAGSLTDADFLGPVQYALADGRTVRQQVFRLKTLQIGDRTMRNIVAAVGSRKSRPILGQSFLRRLHWWKIDNVRNSIELEFGGAY